MSTRTMYPAHETTPARGGIGRALSDRLLGPGASSAEIALALGSAALAAVALPALAWRSGVEWSMLQWVVATALAADLAGGVVVNASAPARRFYFRAGRSNADHLGFVALHLVHILLFTWLFIEEKWWLGLVISAGLLIAAAVIRSAPLHLRRPISMLAVLVAMVATSAISIAPGLEWFVPVVMLKLLVCYLLGDVPAVPEPIVAPRGEAFSAGAEIGFLSTADPLQIRDLARRAGDPTRQIESLQKVVDSWRCWRIRC